MTVYSELDLTIESKRYASPRARTGLRPQHPILNSFALPSSNWPVLSQQSPKVPFEPRKSWGLFWLANPLDLTPGFLRANREFWGKIALIGSNAPIPRIVYASMMATRHYAARSAEANKVDREITTQVKATRAQRESLWTLATPSHRSQQQSPECFLQGQRNASSLSSSWEVRRSSAPRPRATPISASHSPKQWTGAGRPPTAFSRKLGALPAWMAIL